MRGRAFYQSLKTWSTKALGDIDSLRHAASPQQIDQLDRLSGHFQSILGEADAALRGQFDPAVNSGWTARSAEAGPT